MFFSEDDFEVDPSPHIASFNRFFQLEALKLASSLEDRGLHRLLNDYFSTLLLKNVRLHYWDYFFKLPPADEESCFEKKRTFERELVVRFDASISGSSERIEVSFGEVPFLTGRGSFIIRGIERVPVAQMALAPGLYFRKEDEEDSPTLSTTFVPERGLYLKLSVEQRPKKGPIARARAGGGRSCLLSEFLEKMGFLEEAEKKLGHFPVFQNTLRERERRPLVDRQRDFYCKHFFTESRTFSLSRGRQRINERLGLSLTQDHLSPGEIFAALEHLFAFGEQEKWFQEDDLGHLKNLKVRLVGDFLEDLFRRTLYRIAQMLQQRLPLWEEKEIALQRIPEILRGYLKRYLLRSHLNQVLDQTNPLAELSHRRKLTCYGPGGLRSPRGHLDRRSVHPSHYGRLCPLETPESVHIGLNLHLASYARVDPDGQLLTPYKRITDDEIEYVSPHVDEKCDIAPYGWSGPGEPNQPDYTDSFPDQFLGLAASLIPFIQHNDGARAMMGAKNMKQALPLKDPEQPLVKTGKEAVVARLSGRALEAVAAGVVEEVTLQAIVLRSDEGEHISQPLIPLKPTHRKTCLFHRPVVEKGERVEIGQVIADGSGMRDGELALGRNLLVAYMPWKGYNFEDAIVVSRRLKEAFTSLHVRELEFPLRYGEATFFDVKSPFYVDPLLQMTEEGIVREGVAVRRGDILVRVYKTRNEKPVLEWKPKDYFVPEGIEGTVIRAGYLPWDDPHDLGVKGLVKVWIKAERPLEVGDKLTGRHGNKGVVAKIVPEEEMPHLEDGTPVDIVLNPHGVISRMNMGQILETHYGWIAQRHPDSQERARVRGLGRPFTGVDERELGQLLHAASLSPVGKTRLRDGKKGDFFAGEIVVGYQYFLKLDHRAEDKFHVRRQGEYTQVPQQPTKGRARGGGQRLGEMEVWALEAHLAPNLLAELLSLKSDDLLQREKVCEISEKEDNLRPNLGEALRVLILYLRGMGLDLKFYAQGESNPVLIGFGLAIEAEGIERAEISLASKETIRGWSGGPVKRSEIEEVYEEKSFSCRCGKKKGESNEGKSCRECGGKVRLVATRKRRRWVTGGLFCEEIFGRDNVELFADRREKMGHIELSVPIAHPLCPEHTLGVLPVIPPDLRPFRPRVIGDLNELYLDVIRANNRLKRLQEIGVRPDEIERGKRTLAEAVGGLIQGGRKRRGRRLHSLGDLVKGKKGFLRQHLLGKRVDFSGRAVIVPDPALKLGEFGLPYRMALELLKPRVIQRLIAGGACEVRVRQMAEEAQRSENEETRGKVKTLLEEILREKDYLFLLNRAPSLHKYNLLSFRPVITDHLAISLPPLVCGGFNADFDGDTMALHLPLTAAAQKELRRRCRPEQNMLSAADGSLMLHFSQDIPLGIYHLTLTPEGRERLAQIFSDSEISFPLEAVTGGKLKEMVGAYLRNHGPAKTRELVEGIKAVAFEEATCSGLTFSFFDVVALGPQEREHLRIAVQNASPDQGAEEINQMWKKMVQERLKDRLKSPQNRGNPVSLMFNSGARGNLEQMANLGGIIGIIAMVDGSHYPIPVETNFKEGLSQQEYFIASFGSRKTMIDKKLKTGEAGDLTRRLVEAAYPLIVRKEDCGAEEGITLPLARAVGRTALEEVRGPGDEKATMKRDPPAQGRALSRPLIRKGEMIDEEVARRLEEAAIEKVRVRSVLRCQETEGVCAACYGWDLSKRSLVEKGLPVGIIAGQSIGERGTQLTMRTFHRGAGWGEDITRDIPSVRKLFENWLQDEKEEKDLSKILQDQGIESLYEFLAIKLRSIYEGGIDDRHFEVILRSMLKGGGLVGITEAALDAEGFLAAAAFQRAVQVLAVAALEGKIDHLKGYKERIILGKFIGIGGGEVR